MTPSSGCTCCGSQTLPLNKSRFSSGSQERRDRCVIGFAAVIPENWKTASAEHFVEKICSTIDETAFARVTVEDWDLLSHGD